MRILLSFILFIALQSCKQKDKEGLVLLPQKKLKKEIELLRDILQATHPGLYLYSTEKEMNDLFAEVENEITTDLSELEYFKLVSKIIYNIKCSHTSVMLSRHTDSLIIGQKSFFPIPVVYVEGKIIVNTKDFSIPIGSSIHSINKNDATAIFSALKFFNYADGYNSVYKKFAIENSFAYDYFCAFGGSKNFIVQYTDTSSKTLKTAIIQAMTKRDLDKENYMYTGKPTDIDYDFDLYDNQLATITINTFAYDSDSKQNAYMNFLNHSFELLQYNRVVKNLIVDLRENGGGDYSNALELYAYLANTPVYDMDSSVSLFRRVPYKEWLTVDSYADVPSIEKTQKEEYKMNSGGTFTNIDSFKTLWAPYPNAFKGKLFILVNENTASAASLIATLLQTQKRAVIVGSETLTCYAMHTAGNFLTYSLPYSGIQVTIPLYTEYKKTLLPKNAKGKCLQPDYVVEPTIKDIIAGNGTEFNYVTDSLLKME
jgi:hypothetical protein